jgi:hypothetical protein
MGRRFLLLYTIDEARFLMAVSNALIDYYSNPPGFGRVFAECMDFNP